MTLDRPAIERTDFPLGRRGYDPAAVDAHLRSIADQVEELARASARRATPLASTASDQVRGIVDAAEASAATIRQQAEADARAHVERVKESATRLLESLDTMQAELGALYESLRSGAQALLAKLGELDSHVSVARAGLSPAAPGAGPAERDEDGSPGREGDLEGARLIALNMALSGAPREQTEGYLVEQFGLRDARALLEEIYALVEG